MVSEKKPRAFQKLQQKEAGKALAITTKNEKKENEQAGSLIRFLPDSSIRAMDGEGNERKFTLSFSSETPYDRWWGREILSHSDGSVDLTRLNSIGCVLFNHNRDKVLGKVSRAWTEDGRGMAEIEFDTDDSAEVIRRKVAGGTLRGVSVGYMVDVWEEVAPNKKSSDGRFTGPCDIAVKWMPYEISIVSVPADPTVGVGRSHDNAAPSGSAQEERGASCFYYRERQLQINKNFSKEDKRL